MGKVIEFPRSRSKLQSFLSGKLESGMRNLPKDLAGCLRNSFSDLLSFSIVKERAFSLVVSDDLPEEEISKIKQGVEEIIRSYERDILPVLRRLAEKEAELCMLKYQHDQ